MLDAGYLIVEGPGLGLFGFVFPPRGRRIADCVLRMAGVELALFGFVFRRRIRANIGVSPCGIRCCGALPVLEIGFVLHNRHNTAENASLRDRKNAEKIGLWQDG